MMNLAYLALGSNIDPENHLREAVRLLAQMGRILAVSSVWETPPVGLVEQPNFLNAALLLETECTPDDLRATILRPIEQTLHRVRTENPNAPRTIDLDLALFNQEVMTVGHRHIPDPDILTRAFVAIPLAEIAPAYIHPETGQTLRDIAAGLRVTQETMKKREDVRLWEPRENEEPRGSL